MFGRGQRKELDDEEGEELARLMREELVREVKRIRESEHIDLDADADAEDVSNAAKIKVKL
jgi:phosphoribosylformylglycinamidine (FGAM) synthase PurS component